MFNLEASSTTPIYRQLMDQVRRHIASGQLKAGDPLPSVRELAATLAVNPNTVSKAYSLLEHDKVIERPRRGMGMTVATSQETPEALLAPALTRLIQEAHELGLSRAQIVRLIDKHWEKLP